MSLKDDDWDDDSFGEVFGQRHPPLSIYIKGILERYPDGQIFKVSETFMPTINYRRDKQW